MNKYPLAIERSISDSYRKAFADMTQNLLSEIQKDLSADYSLKVRESVKNAGRADSIFNIYSKLRQFAQSNFSEIYNNLQSELLGKFQVLDSWVKSKIEESVNDKSRLLKLARPKQLALVNGEWKYIYKPLEKKIVIENGIVKTKYITEQLAISPLKNQIEKANRLMSEKIKEQAVKSAELIKGIQTSTADRLSQKISDAYNKGKTQSEINAIVQKSLKVSEGRAATIGRDQTQKFGNEINRERQKAVGITKFIWRTMDDNRVRDTHKHVDGKVFDWETGAQGLLDLPKSKFPGDDINCRCYPEPYDEELTEEEKKIASKIKVRLS